MQVSEEVLQAFLQTSNNRILEIRFPYLELIISNDKIYSESAELKEDIVSGNKFEFVGCVSSKFSVKISDTTHDFKNQYVEVYIMTQNTTSEPVPLFKGYVYDVELQSNKRFKKITCYDSLYSLADMDITDWYNELDFPINIRDFRYSLFRYIGIAQIDTDLPNDDIVIDKIQLQGLNCLRLIKNICQINAVFGIINRYGRFEYRSFAEHEESEGMYPGITLFPGTTTFPGTGASGRSGGADSLEIAYYKKIDFVEYKVNPVDRITITKDEQSVSHGEGDNNYIIKNNFFAKSVTTDVMRQMAYNVYDNVANVEFIPFTAENIGLPFVECGSYVSYFITDFVADQKVLKTFLILSRSISGVQALKDKYSAEGEEFQREFVTEIKAFDDVVTQSNVQSVVANYTYSKQEFPTQVNKLIDQKKWFEVVDVAPPVQTPGVIYFVRKK